jgi:ABC-type polysaccharide/polyol phosphate export permease
MFIEYNKNNYMNTIKKFLGYVWMLMAPCIILFLVYEAYDKIYKANATTQSNVILQWVIILLIFTPICVGFFIFGSYASKGEYD